MLASLGRSTSCREAWHMLDPERCAHEHDRMRRWLEVRTTCRPVQTPPQPGPITMTTITSDHVDHEQGDPQGAG